MPALITHHIFGEDAAALLPAGAVVGSEELLAFLLGNQGPDPLFSRFTCGPRTSRACWLLAHRMQSGRVVEAFSAMREGVGRLPRADARIGRAFALGVMGHYALDRVAHPFVIAQQRALVAADPSLASSPQELHATIESDLDEWTLWERRRATVLERPTQTHLMRTPRVCRVAGALLSQVAASTFQLEVGACEYGRAVADYEAIYRAIEPAGSPRSRLVAGLERAVRGRSLAQASAHYARRTSECPAANLARRAWADPEDGRVSHESFADVYERGLADFPALAAALDDGDAKRLAALVDGLDYEGRRV